MTDSLPACIGSAEFELLTERIARLERANRGIRWAIVTMAIGTFAMMAAGANPGGVPESIEAQEFVLRSPEGKRLARLGTNPVDGTPSLQYWDPQGRERLALTMTELAIMGKVGKGLASDVSRIKLGLTAEGDAALQFRDDQGKSCAYLGVGKDDVPKLVLRDRNEEDRVDLSVTPESAPRLLFLAENRKRRAGIVEGADGGISLGLHDNDGGLRLSMGVATDGVSSVDFFDVERKRRGAILLNQDGAVMLNFLDQNGQGRVRLEVKPDGTPNFSLLDPKGAPLFQAPQP